MARADYIRLGPDFNPGGAFWCTEHPPRLPKGAKEPGGRLECTKTSKKSGKRCHEVAMRGMNACRLHSGISKEKAKAMGEAKVISAWSAVGAARQQMEPGPAVLAMLQQAWLRAHIYSQMLRQQVGDLPVVEELAAAGDEVTDRALDGLIGHRKAAAGQEGFIYDQSEEIRALVALEAAERDRVVKYAKIAHDMGISDRMTAMAEQWGDSVATAVTAMLGALQLTPEQQGMVPRLVESYLGSLELGG